jgi:hypothetical protein
MDSENDSVTGGGLKAELYTAPGAELIRTAIGFAADDRAARKLPDETLIAAKADEVPTPAETIAQSGGNSDILDTAAWTEGLQTARRGAGRGNPEVGARETAIGPAERPIDTRHKPVGKRYRPTDGSQTRPALADIANVSEAGNGDLQSVAGHDRIRKVNATERSSHIRVIELTKGPDAWAADSGVSAKGYRCRRAKLELSAAQKVGAQSDPVECDVAIAHVQFNGGKRQGPSLFCPGIFRENSIPNPDTAMNAIVLFSDWLRGVENGQRGFGLLGGSGGRQTPFKCEKGKTGNAQCLRNRASTTLAGL